MANWGESFWRSYNYAADAKLKRAEYAKWLQDKTDREQANTLMKEHVKLFEENSVAWKESDRLINEERALTAQEHKMLDEQLAKGAIKPDAYAKQRQLIEEQHLQRSAPLEQAFATESQKLAMWAADNVTNIVRQAPGNEYVVEAAKVVMQGSATVAQSIADAGVKRDELNAATRSGLMEQGRMAEREEADRAGSMALEEKKHENTLSEIRARESGGGGGAGGTGIKDKDARAVREKALNWATQQLEKWDTEKSGPAPTIDQLINDYIARVEPRLAPEGGTGQSPDPAAAPAAGPATDKLAKTKALMGELEANIQRADDQLSKEPGLAGVDPKSPDYATAMKRDDGVARSEKRRQMILTQRAEWSKILDDLRQKLGDTEQEAFGEVSEDFGAYLDQSLEEVQ